MTDWTPNPEHTTAFITRWQPGGGSERANYQLFLLELCQLLDLPTPDPASDDTRDNAYVFERRVIIKKPDGTVTNGFIDLYKRGSFVLEAKQSGLGLDTSGWDKAMLRAHNQADQYVRALPVDEGRPPFIVVTDVGRSIELYAEFSRSGATYTPFPDARSHRISLDDLRNPAIQQRLRNVWLDPLALDPSREAARVTRDIADQLAKLAKSLEADGHPAQQVADFMMRALFTMFAEDVGLLPEHSFADLLERLKTKPDTFAPMLEHLWASMNSGGFSPILERSILRFNGGLFASPQALPLNRDQIELLIKAAAADWTHVEPAIFGTLLERALDPRERHKLGAHYTPRAYVERLVFPTVIEPLRREWQEVQTAALAYQNQNKHKQAIAEIRAFHQHLCHLRILDPACGSGNFLYVTLEHMKRLEGEVLGLLHDLGESQGLLEMDGITVDPHQFLGLEINPRAARIAEMVLWIGYLQWHYRTHGKVNPPEPVLRDFKNIENRDALITYDSQELICDDSGQPLTRWDGITYKTSPVTGEQIPDESAQIEQYRYLNPQKSQWPQADYIVGNPPFIGNKRMRTALGDGYVDALRKAWSEVPDTSDFVMYWWHIGASTAAIEKNVRFGFITTNSITMLFNRKVIDHHISKNINIAFAIPDHPWVDSADGAAVRISMTVADSSSRIGTCIKITNETATSSDEVAIKFTSQKGLIHSDLRIGADIASTKVLKSNKNISFMGVILVGTGFVLEADDTLIKVEPEIIKPYLNGRDLTQIPRASFVIDFFGFTEKEAMTKFPACYQRVHDLVKPAREQVKRESHRKEWWLFGEKRPAMRNSFQGLNNFIGTTETAKHRTFSFISTDILPDQKIRVISSHDSYTLGVLSSRAHIFWALASGGRLENRPVYNNTRCFETFPFPDPSEEQKQRIRELAERLDAHRKRQQEQHPDLTLTNMYNVLEKLRSGEPLTAKEKTTHEQGLVSVLRELHDDLDRAVFDAYGWNDLAEQLVGLPGATTPLPDKPETQAAAEEELLKRLVDLNAQRAAEEAQGHIRWLRPDYQNPTTASDSRNGITHDPDCRSGFSRDPDISEQTEADLHHDDADNPSTATSAATGKTTWPKTMREQITAVRTALTTAPQTPEQLATQFKRNPVTAVQSVLDALQELGIVTTQNNTYTISHQK